MDDQHNQQDQQDQQDQPGQHVQLELVSMDELVSREIHVILGRHGFVTAEGKPDKGRLADELEPIVRRALVEAPGDRTKKLAWANDLTNEVFPEVPGRALWVEQDNPELAEKVWSKLRGEITRVLNTSPKGEMQRRLATNGGLVLCDTQSTRSGGDRGFYVTRNPKCITEDLGNPARQKALNAMNQYAALTEMAIERVPEHATKFSRDYKSGQKLITEGPASVVAGALQVASPDHDDNGSDE